MFRYHNIVALSKWPYILLHNLCKYLGFAMSWGAAKMWVRVRLAVFGL